MIVGSSISFMRSVTFRLLRFILKILKTNLNLKINFPLVLVETPKPKLRKIVDSLYRVIY